MLTGSLRCRRNRAEAPGGRSARWRALPMRAPGAPGPGRAGAGRIRTSTTTGSTGPIGRLRPCGRDRARTGAPYWRRWPTRPAPDVTSHGPSRTRRASSAPLCGACEVVAAGEGSRAGSPDGDWNAEPVIISLPYRATRASLSVPAVLPVPAALRIPGACSRGRRSTAPVLPSKSCGPASRADWSRPTANREAETEALPALDIGSSMDAAVLGYRRTAVQPTISE